MIPKKRLNKRLALIKSTHSRAEALSLSNPAYWNSVRDLLNGMLSEDLGSGDITTDLFIGADDRKISAKIISKCSAVVAGMDEIKKFFSEKGGIFKGMIVFKSLKNDSDNVKKGDIIAEIKGSAFDILKAERVILNFLQRMSGIATLTAQYKKLVPNNVLIVPTRKSLWGMVDKKACIAGGGGTHRINLSDAILIKDNHIALVGGDFAGIFNRLGKTAKKGRFIEIEVQSPAEAFEVIELYKKTINAVCKTMTAGKKDAGDKTNQPLFIMFDNFSARKIKETIKKISADPIYDKIFFEASGGITLKNIKEYGETGVDIISVGALTHSAPAADFSMRF
jgi:nicotinate-nucleotide pyrophosphorylase (carboxylating)